MNCSTHRYAQSSYCPKGCLFISSSKTRVCVKLELPSSHLSTGHRERARPDHSAIEERSVRSRWVRRMCQVTSKVSVRQEEELRQSLEKVQSLHKYMCKSPTSKLILMDINISCED